MKKLILATTLLFCSFISAIAQNVDRVDSPVDYVSTLVGSQSKYSLSNGNTYPAVARPWGMNFWTPQTGRRGDGWAYTYDADKIVGFKQTHQPSPWINDYGQFSLMPTTGTIENFSEVKRASWFSHKTEKATPYNYSVYLADHDITAELAPTDRSAIFSITYPKSDSSFLVVDAFGGGSWVKILPAERKIIGYSTQNSGGVPENFKNYFVIEFDKAFTLTATFDGDTLHRGTTEMLALHSGAVVGFATERGEKVNIKVSSSFISHDQAAENLRREVAGKTYAEIRDAGRKIWNDHLGRFEVGGGTIDEVRTFYSMLYRSLLFPRKFYEIAKNGDIIHYSPYNGQVVPGYMYTDTGFWDTFRCLFPLLNMMFPTVNAEIQQGLACAALESGFLPEWASPGHRGCMIGNNSSSVIADAYLKGVRTKEIDVLYKTAFEGANKVHPTVSSTGRLGYEYYNTLGYVPSDVKIHENAARTLEYAYNDWCLYMLGKEIGRPQAELDTLLKRSLNYKNLYDPEHKLMRGRKANGEFQTPFNPLKWGDAFTEGNSWHYTWSVFHDIQGLIDLMGGKEEFTSMMDSIFSVPPTFDESYYGHIIHEIREMQIVGMGNYAHGNQPIQHFIYLYNYAGQPWKTQYWIREVMNRLYRPTPDGYCGDEDNGQTSAWYVFSALGFYPVTPGAAEYVIGTPLFKKSVLHLENGKRFEILAPAASDANRYIQSVKINGKVWPHNYIPYSVIANGGTMIIEMGDQPNLKRGTSKNDVPYSLTNQKR